MTDDRGGIPVWVCRWCGHHSATDDLGRMHEARCKEAR